MLYGSDVEEAEITMPTPTGSGASELEWLFSWALDGGATFESSAQC